LSIVKTRLWLPGRFRGGLEKMLSLTGTEGSNPSPSCGESVAKFRFRARARPERPRTTVLTIAVNDLLERAGPARVSYILGYKTRS